MRPSDDHDTAYVTMGQHDEFLRMPFGMVNSGMTMRRAVRRLLEGMDNVGDYIDYLLLHTKTWEEHLQVLHELFKRLRAVNLVGRPTKCELGARLDFRTKTLRKRLTTKKEIRSFLGLVGFYQLFLPNFAAIAALLSYLTFKGPALKVMCGEPQENVAYKMHPDVNKKFVMRTDASAIGLGATLLQNKVGYFVAYTSRKLLVREKR